MAEKVNFGTLGNLNKDQYESLSYGVQSLNNPFQILGKSIPKNTLLTTGLGMATGLSTPMAFGNAIGSFKAQSAADQFLNKPNQDRGFYETGKRIGTGVQEVRNMIPDLNKDNIISNYEMNKFGQNIQGLDLAPMYNYKKDDLGNAAYPMVSKNVGRPYMESGKTMPADATANPYSSGRLTNQMQDKEFKSAMGSYALQDMADQGTGMKSTSDYAGDAINQTNVIGMEGYDKNYADAVTRESQEEAGSSEAGSTFICTALYKMGDMKKSIYKYDKLYGSKVDPAIYRGYALWGEPLAKQIMKKGMMYKLIKPIALTWANQMAYDLSKGKIGKNSLAIKITKTIGEGICYALGQIFKRRQLWLKSQ